MNYVLHCSICGALIAVIVGLLVYRKWLEDYCDHYIHLHNDSHDASIIREQMDACKRIEVIDRTKNYLIAAVVVYGLTIIAIATYNAWSAI